MPRPPAPEPADRFLYQHAGNLGVVRHRLTGFIDTRADPPGWRPGTSRDVLCHRRPAPDWHPLCEHASDGIPPRPCIDCEKESWT